MQNYNMILDVPHPSILSAFPVQELLARARREWRDVDFEGVVLPLIDDNGVYAETDEMPLSAFCQKSTLTLAEECRQLGLKVYFSVVPSGGFLNVPHLQVIDIAGDASAHLCVNAKESQQILISVVRDAMELASEAHLDIEGIVLDLTDLWPMGATEGRLELTCFCDTCKPILRAHHVPLEWFQAFPSPWNLLLEDSGTGISYVSSLPKDATPKTVVEMSRLKGYDAVFDKAQSETPKEVYAERLLRYLRCRNDMTVGFVRSFFEGLGEPAAKKTKRILVTEGCSYNWTGGAFFRSLDDPGVCDELWADPTDERMWAENVAMRYYLWRRSRYVINAFTSLWRQAQDSQALFTTGLGRYGKEAIRLQLRKRLNQTLGAQISGRYVLRSLPIADRRIGYVAVAMNEEIGEQLIGLALPKESLADLDPGEKKS